MKLGILAARLVGAMGLACAALYAQVSVSGRVVDETGAGVPGVRIELRSGDAAAAAGSSDAAGNFILTLQQDGEYYIRAERLGFYLYQGKAQPFAAGSTRLTVTLNHLQEYSERIDVASSPAAIDPQETAGRKELDNTEIQAVPYPAPQDYRNALPLMNGVLQDNGGRVHVNGGDSNQTNYLLDGFNVSDPVTGQLEARVNIETIQSMDLQTSRFPADNGRGSAGVLNLRTKMGDDRWRFGGTNFIPGVSTDGGFHVNKWTPRLQLSGPLARGRAWFHNGFDGFYSVDVIHGLPHGQNRVRSVTGSNLTRFQVNVTPANILTGSFLANFTDNPRYGLSIVNPVETTSNNRQTLYMSSIRDQHYFNGALLDIGMADTRTLLRNRPQGDEVYQITPLGNRGNYFTGTERRGYRQQWIATLFLPTVHFHGQHQLKAGFDIERQSFHQQKWRHPYEVLRGDNSVARRVSFEGNPFQARKNFEGAQFIQDHWIIRERLTLEAGLRTEWNEIARDAQFAPRFSVAWAPSRLANTKFSAGWGIYYDSISLLTITRPQDQASVAMFFPPGQPPLGPVTTQFQVNERSLRAPSYRAASIALDRKLPLDFHLRAEYTRRAGNHGFTFVPLEPWAAVAQFGGASYDLRNTRRDRYSAFDIGIRHTFAGQYEWFAGYTRSSSRTDKAIDYSIENPVFGSQAPGPFPWDSPHRFHMWGWLPLPNRQLPPRLRFITRNTTAAYLVEYRTGFPFSVVDEQSLMSGAPGSRRLPSYFNINLHFERKFQLLHALWAWRFGFNNITNNGNPNSVNNVMGTPEFLTYGRGQARAFSVRLRFLGRK